MKRERDWIEAFNAGARRGFILLGFLAYAYLVIRCGAWMLLG